MVLLFQFSVMTEFSYIFEVLKLALKGLKTDIYALDFHDFQ